MEELKNILKELLKSAKSENEFTASCLKLGYDTSVSFSKNNNGHLPMKMALIQTEFGTISI